MVFSRIVWMWAGLVAGMAVCLAGLPHLAVRGSFLLQSGMLAGVLALAGSVGGWGAYRRRRLNGAAFAGGLAAACTWFFLRFLQVTVDRMGLSSLGAFLQVTNWVAVAAAAVLTLFFLAAWLRPEAGDGDRAAGERWARAGFLGLTGVAVVCGVTYFNDWVMRQTMFVGNVMPIAVYGGMILFVLLLNPLLFRLCRRLGLGGREIALVLVLTLSACCIPGSGLMRYMTNAMLLPHHQIKTQPAWQQQRVFESLPPAALVKVTPENENRVLNGFIQGLGSARRHIPVSAVPWREWLPSLAFWAPVILLFWLALIGLTVVLHRQWADHEQLPYPIAGFANAILPGGNGALAEVFRNRLFWWGMGAVMVIHLNNFAYVWFPDFVVQIPLFVDFQGLKDLFVNIQRGGGVWWVLRPTLCLTAVAFAFFLAADVSLALGIGPVLYCWISGMLIGYGITVQGPSPSLSHGFSYGAYFGTLLVLLYTGRRYYSQVLKAAVCLPAPDRPDGESVWGARLFLVSILGFIAYLSAVGRLEWPFAVAFAGIAVITFVVLSRVVAETGCFFVQGASFPAALVLGLVGSAAVGPQAVMLLALFSVILMADLRETLMSFMVNNFKLLDLQGIKIGRSLKLVVTAVVVGLFVAIPVTLYQQYDRGTNMTDWSGAVRAPGLAFAERVQVQQRLESQDLLVKSETLHGLSRLALARMDRPAVTAMVLGLALVLLFTLGRLHFSRWPLHPVMFLVWGMYSGYSLAASFLMGWLIKVLVSKFGGGAGYKTVKPLMIGVIAGEMAAGLVIMIISAVYYFATDQTPKGFFGIMPG